jgi:hypothetical protein
MTKSKNKRKVFVSQDGPAKIAGASWAKFAAAPSRVCGNSKSTTLSG